jgi:hypothetical protein
MRNASPPVSPEWEGNMRSCFSKSHGTARKGAIAVFAAVLLIVLFGMVALALDVGYMLCTRTEAQRSVDAGALAGAGALGEGPAAAEEAARQFVEQNIVGGRPVTYQETRVELGAWNDPMRLFETPADRPSAVRVSMGRANQSLFFARVLGHDRFTVQAEAVAVHLPRDMVVVLDYSSSMNDDSELRHISRLGKDAIVKNLYQIYTEMGSPRFGDLQWEPVYVSSGDSKKVKELLGLDQVPYPFPSGSWDDYIRYVQTSGYIQDAGYRKRYGYLTLVNYWLERQPSSNQTPGLWMTSEQPITAVKDALLVFLAYLQEAGANDRVGLAVYTYSDGGGFLESPLTYDYRRIEDISRQRQAGHYRSYTNIGAGMEAARRELERDGRDEALKMIVLMTDGKANRPVGPRQAKEFVMREAQLAAAAQFPIVTVSLGATADKNLMQQVADVTDGIHFNIPGGQSVAGYEEDLKEVFREIAGHRPVKLVL